MRRSAKAVWGAVLIMAVFASGCSALANRLILFPSNGAIGTDAARGEFTGRSGPIAGATIETYYQEYGPLKDVPDAYVLALTGNAGRAEITPHCAAQLLPSWTHGRERPLRLGVLAVQYPGYGASDGAATFAGIAAAAIDAFDELRAEAGDRPVLVYGFSLGSTAALHVARHREQVAGLLIEKPPNLRAFILGEYGWWNLWLLAGPVALGVPESARSDINAAAIDGVPAVFLVGQVDEIAPPRYAQQVIDAYRGPKRAVPAAVSHDQAIDGVAAPDLEPALHWLRKACGL